MLESLFPMHVICVEGPINSLQEHIHSAEEWCVRHAVRKRRREFIAGRVCARRALAQLGIEGYPLLPDPNRYPRWPPGVVGSISHSSDYCAVVVAKAGVTLALGLDVEQVDPLDAELWALVLHGSEHCWLDRQPESERGRLAKLIFSVKECAFKCQYPLFGEGWEFEDLVVKFDDREWFEVHVRKTPRTGRLAGAKLEGRYRISGEQIITAMVFAEDTVK